MMLFEKYVLCDDGFGSVRDEHGEITGFQLKARLPYYRAVRLSLVEEITVKVDGQAFPADEIYVTVADGTFSLKEMQTCYDLYWGFGEEAVITVRHPDGYGRAFTTGWHAVELGVRVRICYVSGGFGAVCTKMLYEEY